MKKYIVETYYTCTFRTVHKLDDLNEAELSKIDILFLAFSRASLIHNS